MKRFLAVLAVLLIAAVPLCAQTMYKATLTWTDNSDNEDGFKVERNDGTQSGPFSEIASLPANSLSYVDQPLAPGEGHCWRILAFNSVGSSLPSTAACAVAPPSVTIPAAPGGTTVIITIAP